MADKMQPTPRNSVLGLFSDLVNLPLQYMSSPERTQQMQGTAQFLYGTGIPKTLERMSYGDSLFSGAGGLGGTTRMRPETAEALMNVAPFVPAAGRVGRTVGRLAGEEINAAMTGQPTRSLLGQMTPKPKQIFIGESAKTWDKANAEKFLQLEKSGVDPVDAWKQTGTFRSPDGKLRQEISDQPARWQPTKWDQPYQEAPEIDRARIQEALSHPELFKAYPQLGQKDVFLDPTLDSLAAWNRANPSSGIDAFMKINQDVYPKRPDVALHELQHGVQELEGFASGGSLESAPLVFEPNEVAQRVKNIREQLGKTIYGTPEYKLLEDKLSQLSAQMKENASLEGYMRLAGEAEARAVEKRMGMTPEQRLQNFPLESYDRPVNSLLFPQSTIYTDPFGNTIGSSIR
jgi:hypothetical protein